MVIEKFKKLLRMEQQTVKLLVHKYLFKIGYEPQWKDGCVYAEGDIPVLLVAHMDTVHKNKPTEIYYDPEEDVMWSPQGIGGDDRCGVFAILEILKTHKPYVLFTEDEEIGCIGAKKAVEKLKKPKVNFIIELDRRGINDCVFYDCDNKEFHRYIESFGFESNWGSFSDICHLSDAWDIASVNLSIGYNREHTTSEVIYTNVMEQTIEKVKKILDDAEKNKKFFKYDRKVYHYKVYRGGYDYGYDYDDFDWNYGYKKKTNEIGYDNELEEKDGKENELQS